MMRYLLIAALCLSATPAIAQGRDESQRLSSCLSKIEENPEEAYEDALAWLGSGGRPGARQCAALALIALGQEAEGAARLEQLANDPDAGALDARAVYLAQAGNAWLLAGAPEAGITALTNAMKLKPRDVDLKVDRARAYMLAERWADAESDLSSAISLSPGEETALALRARTMLKLDRLDEAWRDITAALVRTPRNVDFLVLRGDIREARRLKGLPDL
jgi:tetratricopeptide (TPR) repeat protein